jgi:hypothetical protein
MLMIDESEGYIYVVWSVQPHIIVIISGSRVCGLMVAWYYALICTIVYIFKRFQLGSEAASWIFCQY